MKTSYILLIAAFIILLICGIAWSASYYHGQYSKEKERADKAEATTNNVITAVNLFNDIAKATHEAKDKLDADSQERIVYIKKTLATEPCANQLIPSSVVDSLR